MLTARLVSGASNLSSKEAILRVQHPYSSAHLLHAICLWHIESKSSEMVKILFPKNSLKVKVKLLLLTEQKMQRLK